MEASEARKKNRRPIIKCHWTIVEDNLLTELVGRYGAGNWPYIAQHFQRRNAKSCRLRWLNQLSPAINKTPFTAVENARLLELHRGFGNMWSTIVRFFPGRTDNQLKNQYHYLAKDRCLPTSVRYSSFADHCSLERGSVNENFSAAVVSSQSVNDHQVENNYGTCNNSSSVYARDEPRCARSFEGVNLGKKRRYDMTCPSDSMLSDANSRAILELFPMSKPEEGICSRRNTEVIDFMGVGSSK